MGRPVHTDSQGGSVSIPVEMEGGYPIRDDAEVQRAFANPCLYCGLAEDEAPFEDTDEHRDTSQHQWTVYNS